ncbi:MAG: 1-deoxy-D-xylulose-5-phosphate reductoisomerase, partial [Solobacterium sp.]|nr:1-deoxy-D-xylulose-5-phosphate reductoisomerase [Solobacterium sp.]
MKRLMLLGASGSIGTQTIDVVLQHPDEFSIVGLSVGHRIDILKEILKKIHVSHVCVCEEKDMKELA